MKKILISALVFAVSAFLSAEIVDWTVVTIDNEALTFSYLKSSFNEYRETARKFGDPGTQINTLTDVMDRLISNEILTLEAVQRDINVSEKEIDERIKMFKKMNQLSDDMFRRVLKEQNIRMSELRDNYEQQIRNEKLQQIEIQPKIEPPSDDEMRSFYEENQDMMKYPERRRVHHILFVNDPDMPLSEQKKQTDLIQNVYTRAVRGEDFGQLARKYSDDEASKHIGGDLGWIERGSYYPEFEEVVFGLKRGSVSQVFPTRSGFHIAKVVSVKKAETKPYEEAKLEIRNYLLQEAMHREFLAWIEEKRSIYGIRVILKDGRTFVLTRDVWMDEQTGKDMPQDKFYQFLEKEFKKY